MDIHEEQKIRLQNLALKEEIKNLNEKIKRLEADLKEAREESATILANSDYME